MTRAFTDTDAARLQLRLIRGDAWSGFFEVRCKQPGGGIERQFVSVGEPDAVLCIASTQGAAVDVYVGLALRTSENGTRQGIGQIKALWADCDGDEAVNALYRFPSPPTLLLRSGSGRNVLAVWELTEPVSGADAERANRRLAFGLRADPRSTDRARIGRIAGTYNHKHSPPRRVTVQAVNPSAMYGAHELVGRLPDPPARRAECHGKRRVDPGDELLHIEPAVYIERLTGRGVEPNGLRRCPFHAGGNERTPSLHAYPTPRQGWVCFGCGAGGTVIDFGAALYGLTPRGEGFFEIRERLAADLGLAVAA